MKVTLKKLQAIQQSTLDAYSLLTEELAREHSMSVDFIIHTYADYEKAKFDYATKTANAVTLHNMYYDLRELQGRFNGTSGANSLLTQIAKAKAMLKLLRYHATHPPALTMEQFCNKKEYHENTVNGTDAVSRMRTTVDSYLSLTDQSHIDLLSDEMKQVKRQIRNLEEQLLETNIKTEVILSESLVDKLKEFDIL